LDAAELVHHNGRSSVNAFDDDDDDYDDDADDDTDDGVYDVCVCGVFGYYYS
jgi:hypothetical protein